MTFYVNGGILIIYCTTEILISDCSITIYGFSKVPSFVPWNLLQASFVLHDLIDLWEVWFFGAEKKCAYIYLKEKNYRRYTWLQLILSLYYLKYCYCHWFTFEECCLCDILACLTWVKHSKLNCFSSIWIYNNVF